MSVKNYHYKFPIAAFLVLCGIIFFVSACRKFVEVPVPPTQIANAAIFENEQTLNAAITGIYSRMMAPEQGFASGGLNSVTTLAGLSADEFSNYSFSQDYQEFSMNTIAATNPVITSYLWSEPFQFIFTANSILEGLPTATNISDALRSKAMGEVKFIRAFCNFYLVNLFGDIPSNTITDYRITSRTTRVDKATVYKQITEDLLSAVADLPGDYSSSNGARIRPNRYAAQTLLARVYLYTGNWSEAASASSDVINSGQFSIGNDLKSVFLANSDEAIWQLMPVVPGLNTWEAQTFILNGYPSTLALHPTLTNSFEEEDKRKKEWVDSVVIDNEVFSFSKKYQVQADANVSEYSMVLRLAELFLIRAEAKMQLNEPEAALSDINVLRNRAGLSSLSLNNMGELNLRIVKERQSELFAEWGHRWLDLQRLGIADSVLGALKPSWKSTAILYPVPQAERQNNPAITQNAGY